MFLVYNLSCPCAEELVEVEAEGEGMPVRCDLLTAVLACLSSGICSLC